MPGILDYLDSPEILYAPTTLEFAFKVGDALTGATLEEASAALYHVKRVIEQQERKTAKITRFDESALLPGLACFAGKQNA